MEIRLCVHRTALVLLAVFAVPAIAQPAFQLDVLTPIELRVAPGQSVSHALRIRNVGDTSGSLRLMAQLNLMNRFSQRPYTFGASSNPRCGVMPTAAGDFIDMTTDSLSAGESLDCEWQVHRPINSDFDAFISWSAGTGPTFTTPMTLIGTLTDTAVSTRTRSFDIDAQGFGRATIDLHVENRGPSQLLGQTVHVCESLGDVLVVESVAVGGCGDVIATSCGVGYEIPSIPTGQTFHCSFNARTLAAYVAPVSSRIQISWEQGSDAGLLLDANEANNAAPILVGPTGDPQAPITLDSLNRSSSLLLAALLCMTSMLVFHRQRRRTSDT